MKDLKLIALVNYIYHSHADLPYHAVIFIADLLHLSIYGRAITDHEYYPSEFNGIYIWDRPETQSKLMDREIIIDDEFYLINELLSESEKECIGKSISLFIEHNDIYKILTFNKWDKIVTQSTKGNKIPFKLICSVVGGQELIDYIKNNTFIGDPWHE